MEIQSSECRKRDFNDDVLLTFEVKSEMSFDIEHKFDIKSNESAFTYKDLRIINEHDFNFLHCKTRFTKLYISKKKWLYNKEPILIYYIYEYNIAKDKTKEGRL